MKTPYRHTPTHAALDALLSAPASARIADRARVVEENRKRSIMAANGMGMTTPTHSVSPRAHSSLSHVSYPTTYASPVVHIPRAYSYSSVPAQAWSFHGSSPMMIKGMDMERVMVDSGRASRSSSRISGSVESSSNSIGSKDEVEMRLLTHASGSRPVRTNIPSGAFAELSIRTYPSHAGHPRRLSDPGCPTASTRLIVLTRGGHSKAIGDAPLVIACIPPILSPPPTRVDTFSGALFNSRQSNLSDAAEFAELEIAN